MRGDNPVSFRAQPTRRSVARGSRSTLAEPPAEPLIVQPNFEVIAPVFARRMRAFRSAASPRARPCEDETETYTLTKRSIQAALERSITLDDMLRFLA